MNELREAILASAYRWAHKVPHVRYGTGPNRFGQTGEYMDCSGFTHTCYREGSGGTLLIGRDTGQIAHDNRGALLPVRAAGPADLVLHRSGPLYDGGSDEHVGLVYRFDGDTLWTYESAGSQRGVGLYPRRAGWWTNSFHYHALDTATSAPTEDDMTDAEKRLLFGILTDLTDKVGWLLAGEIEGGWKNRKPDTLRTPKILAAVSK